MKNLFIVANWKANKTEEEAISWLADFVQNFEDAQENKEVIICPPYTLIAKIKDYIQANALSLKLGSQDVSQFAAGAFTGEVPSVLIQKMVSYSIIGHSERRNKFHESDETVAAKVKNALDANLIPILCAQDENTPIPAGVTLVAYEPIEAIGTGKPDTPQNAEEVAKIIKEKNKEVSYVLYGGSVTPGNVNSFTSMPTIDGVLVGGASLDPVSFAAIIKQC